MSVIGQALVEIVPSTAGFAEKLQKDVDEAVGKVTQKSQTGFDKLASVGGKALLGISAAAVAIGAASVKIADDFESAHARLVTAIEASGHKIDEFGNRITTQESAFARLGFNATAYENALARLTTSINDPTKAIADMGLAANIAAARHIDLTTAAQLVGKVQEGNIGILKRFGIDLGLSTAGIQQQQKAQDALSKAQKNLSDLTERLGATQGRSAVTGAQLQAANDRVTNSADKLRLAQEHLIKIQEEVDSGKLSGQAASDALTKAQDAVRTASDTLASSQDNLAKLTDKAATSAGLSIPQQQQLAKAHDTVSAASEKLAKLSGTADQAIAALNDRFGGQAQAQAETFGGKLRALQAQFENIGIRIGLFLIPYLEQLGSAFVKVVDFFESHTNVFLALASAIGVVLVAAIDAYIVKKAEAVAKDIAGVAKQVKSVGEWVAAHVLGYQAVEDASITSTAVTESQAAARSAAEVAAASGVQAAAAEIVVARLEEMATNGELTGSEELLVTAQIESEAIRTVAVQDAVAAIGAARALEAAEAAAAAGAEDAAAGSAIAAFAAENVALLGIPALIAAVVAGLVYVATHWKQVEDAAKDAWNWIEDHWKYIAAVLSPLIAIFAPIIAGIVLVKDNFQTLKDFITGIPDAVKTGWDDVLSFFEGLPGRIVAFFVDLPGNIVSALSSLPGLLKNFILNLLISWPLDIAADAIRTGKTVTSKLVEGLNTGVTDISKWFGEFLGKIPGWLGTGWDKIKDVGGKILGSITDGLNTAIVDMAKWFYDLPGKILGWLTALFGGGDSTPGGDRGAQGKSLAKSGQSIMGGIIDGLTSGLDAVGHFFGTTLPDFISSSVSNLADEVYRRVRASIGEPAARAIGDAARDIGGAAKDIGAFFARIPGDIVSAIESAPGTLARVGTALANSILSGVESAAGTLAQVGVSILGHIVSGLETAVPAVLSWFNSLPGTIADFIDSAAGYMAGVASSFMSSFISALGTIEGTVADWVSSLPDKISTATFDFTRLAIRITTSLTTALANRVGDFGLWLVNLVPSIITWVVQHSGQFLLAATGIMAALVRGLITRIPDIFRWLTAIPLAIVQWVTSHLDDFVKALPGIIEAMFNWLADHAPDIVKFMERLPGAIISWVQSHGVDMLKIAAAIIGGIVVAFIGVPVLITALGALIAGAILVGIVEGLTRLVGRAQAAVAQWLSEAFSKISETVGPIFERMWNDVVGFAERIWSDVTGWFVRLWTDLTTWSTRIWHDIAGFFGNLWQDIFNWGSRIWSDSVNWFTRVWTDLTNWASRIWHDVSGFFGNLWQDIFNFGSRIWSDITGWFSRTWTDVTGWATRIWHDVMGPFNSLKTDIQNWINDLLGFFQGLEDGIGGIWNSIKSTASTVWNDIVNAVKDPIKTFAKFINVITGGINAITGLLPKAISDTLHIPEININALAGGGITRGPALVGEGRSAYPEFVVPTDPVYRAGAVALTTELMKQLGIRAMAQGGIVGAQTWLGVPYLWGGGHGVSEAVARRLGVDCSGLVDQVDNLTGTTYTLVTQGKSVQGGVTAAVPSDLVFFGPPLAPGEAHHVGIYGGGGQMINAPTTGTVVRWDNVSGFGPIADVRRLSGGGGSIFSSVTHFLGSAAGAALDAAGNALGDVLGAIRRGLADAVLAPLFAAANTLIDAIPIDFIRELGPTIEQDVLNFVAGDFASKIPAAQPPGGVPAASGNWIDVATFVAGALGQPGSVGAITRRIQQESGGDPSAVNRWDSNWLAGHPSVGLVQVIEGTFRAYADKYKSVGPFAYGVSMDPTANVYAGMNYATHRYGSIAAIDPLVKPGGYDLGGWLMPGVTMAVNSTGLPERVLPPGAGGGVSFGPGSVVVNIDADFSGQPDPATVMQLKTMVHQGVTDAMTQVMSRVVARRPGG